MPPFPWNREADILLSAANKLGLHPFPVPMPRNSAHYGGRAACIACRYCVGFACEVNAKRHDAALPAKFEQFQKQPGKDIEPGWDRVREEIPLGEPAMQALAAKCADCRAEQAKGWASSGHAMTCAQSFLSREHNRMAPPMDDCLRCHAMFFEGTARDLVTPLDTRGPWQMVHEELADHRSIPCLVCHQVHAERRLSPPSVAAVSDRRADQHGIRRSETAATALAGDKTTSKAGFYDRRERRFFPAHELPHPKVFDGGKLLPVSDDARIRICVQCHAPSTPHQAGTSDDRTLARRPRRDELPLLPRHASLDTRKSRAQCHHAASSCGLDVTRMDTTARAKGSRHDIHTVACEDCHPQGAPKAKR